MATFQDNYSIISTLAKTNQGRVCRAATKVSTVHVAVKVSDASFKTLERPAEEAQMVRELQDDGGHPNIVRLLDSYEDAKYFFSVWELWDRDLFSFVSERESKGQSLSHQEVRYYFNGFLSGVNYLHRRNIAHLDLSLENTLHAPNPSAHFPLSPAPGAILCDLGQARRLSDVSHVFPPGFRRGRVQYMSPEMYDGLPCNGLENDMFSCGVVLFILLTGLPPFHKPCVQDGAYRFIARGRPGLEVLLKSWKLRHRVSNDALDLLVHLLCPAASRFTVQQALAHPFCTGQPAGGVRSPRGLPARNKNMHCGLEVWSSALSTAPGARDVAGAQASS